MKLHMHPVSCTSRSVLMLLADEGIDCEMQVVDIVNGENRREPYSSFNPNMYVPVLEDDSLKLTESLAILRYISDKLALAVYPRDLKTRAKIDEAIAWFATNFYRDMGYGIVYPQLIEAYRAGNDEVQAAILAHARRNVHFCLGVLNDHMIGPSNRYICGDSLSLADYVGISQITLGEWVGSTYTQYPNVQRWIDTIKARPTWSVVNGPFYEAVAMFKHLPLQPL